MTSLKVEGPTYVYIISAANGEPLYVGVSQDLKARQKAHAKNWWWDDVDSWRLIGPYPNRRIAEQEEYRLIKELDPRFNGDHAPHLRHPMTAAEFRLEDAVRHHRDVHRYGLPLVSDEELLRLLNDIVVARRKVAKERLQLVNTA